MLKQHSTTHDNIKCLITLNNMLQYQMLNNTQHDVTILNA